MEPEAEPEGRLYNMGSFTYLLFLRFTLTKSYTLLQQSAPPILKTEREVNLVRLTASQWTFVKIMWLIKPDVTRITIRVLADGTTESPYCGFVLRFTLPWGQDHESVATLSKTLSDRAGRSYWRNRGGVASIRVSNSSFKTEGSFIFWFTRKEMAIVFQCVRFTTSLPHSEKKNYSILSVFCQRIYQSLFHVNL